MEFEWYIVTYRIVFHDRLCSAQGICQVPELLPGPHSTPGNAYNIGSRLLKWVLLYEKRGQLGI